MRLVDWTEFQTLPSGTIFQEWSLMNLGDIRLLGGCSPYQIIFASITPTPSLGDSLEQGHPHRDHPFVIEMPSGFMGSGADDFGVKQWLIWDEVDRLRLARWLIDPVAAVEKQNDEDAIYLVPERFI